MNSRLFSPLRRPAKRVAGVLAAVGVLAAPVALADPWHPPYGDNLGVSTGKLLQNEGRPCDVGLTSVFLNSNRTPKPAERYSFCAPSCGRCEQQVDYLTRNGQVVGRRVLDHAQDQRDGRQ